MSVNTTQIKEKIIEFIRQRGPSLPVYISKAIDNSILFTSAFLSELVSEKKIKISHMRVGSSPIYFLQGQEPQLEKFSDYLKSKEKDAFFLLKEKKFLQDSSQEPAIRVALRDIKDFALPFKKDNEIYWRYFTASESEMFLPAKKVQEKKPEPKKNLNIFDKPQKSKEQEKKLIKKKVVKKKPAQKTNEKFFNKVKEYLAEDATEILDIVSFSRTDLFLRIRKNQEELLLVAFNKKRIGEIDFINANKKAEELGLKYILLSLGEPLKKLQTLIDAVKNLSGIEKIE